MVGGRDGGGKECEPRVRHRKAVVNKARRSNGREGVKNERSVSRALLILWMVDGGSTM